MPHATDTEYEKDAARAALLYVLQRVGEVDFHKVHKIFYFGERYHLQHFGALMFGETYRAYPYGPVATGAYAAMQKVEAGRQGATDEGFTVERKRLRNGKFAPVMHLRAEPDMSELSRSVLESLDDGIAKCADKDFDALCRLSHDSVWHTARESRTSDEMTAELIASTLPNAASLLKYLADPFPGEAVQKS